MLCQCLHHHILCTYILFIAMTKLLKCYIDSVWCKECTSHESKGLYIYFLYRQFSSVILSIRPWKKCIICRRTQVMFFRPREAYIANLCLTRVQKPLVTWNMLLAFCKPLRVKVHSSVIKWRKDIRLCKKLCISKL